MAELIAALDFPDADSALRAAEPLRGELDWVKVGLELFSATGPHIVFQLKELGFRVFVDLKLFDIPNTVQGAVRSLTRSGVDLCTLHLLGGQAMAQAALAGREEAKGQTAGPLLFGVSLLTSMDMGDLPGAATQDSTRFARDLARSAAAWQLDGVVCSGHEVRAIKRDSPRLACLTPGIRLEKGTDDQKRVMTPEKAIHAGSDFLVVGRPIFTAPSPLEMVRTLRKKMVSPTSENDT